MKGSENRVEVPRKGHMHPECGHKADRIHDYREQKSLSAKRQSSITKTGFVAPTNGLKQSGFHDFGTMC